MARAGGMPEGIMDHESWRRVMEASELQDIVVESNAITAREESRSQAGRIPVADYFRAVPRSIKVLAKAKYRQVFRDALGSTPRDFYNYIGYGVYAGRKR